MEKVYLLSDDFDYSQMISPAAGPPQAKRYRWETDRLNHLGEHQGRWVLIDHRLTESECRRMPELVRKYPDTPFCFSIVDPYYEWCSDHWYYKMLFEVGGAENVFYLSKYEPSEVVKDLRDEVGPERMVVLHYAYPTAQEVNRDWAQKKEEIVFSGNLHTDVYPYRQKFRNVKTYYPLFWGIVSTLDHPGYSDIGESQNHEIVGDKYVRFLSRHQFMFVSPSRCHLEFLKYGECAAAGCLPVGKSPSGFNAELREPFVELDFDGYVSLIRSINRVFAMPEDERQERAASFRSAMKKFRGPERLNRVLDNFARDAWTSTTA